MTPPEAPPDGRGYPASESMVPEAKDSVPVPPSGEKGIGSEESNSGETDSSNVREAEFKEGGYGWLVGFRKHTSCSCFRLPHTSSAELC
jgi:hypothetical protein